MVLKRQMKGRLGDSKETGVEGVQIFKNLADIICERFLRNFVGADDVPNNGYLMPGSPCDNYRVSDEDQLST